MVLSSHAYLQFKGIASVFLTSTFFTNSVAVANTDAILTRDKKKCGMARVLERLLQYFIHTGMARYCLQ